MEGRDDRTKMGERDRRNFPSIFGNLIYRKEIRNRGTTTERGYDGIYIIRYYIHIYIYSECIYIMYTVFPEPAAIANLICIVLVNV